MPCSNFNVLFSLLSRASATTARLLLWQLDLQRGLRPCGPSTAVMQKGLGWMKRSPLQLGPLAFQMSPGRSFRSTRDSARVLEGNGGFWKPPNSGCDTHSVRPQLTQNLELPRPRLRSEAVSSAAACVVIAYVTTPGRARPVTTYRHC